jgi:hypothetical protein
MVDRDILGQIDDIITWHGSRDAMTWTADKPTSTLGDGVGWVVDETYSLPSIDPEVARRFLEQMTGQAVDFMEAFRPIAERIVSDVGAACQTFAAIMSMPGMRDLAGSLVEGRRLERRAMKSSYDRRRRARGRRR